MKLHIGSTFFLVSEYGDKEEIKSMIIEAMEILKVCSKIKNSLYK